MLRRILTALLIYLSVAWTLALSPVLLVHNNLTFLYVQEYLTQLKPINYDVATVYRNVDGDTIVVKIGYKEERVRLIGVDTPETVHPRKPVEYFGKGASLFTKILLKPGDKVYLTYDWNPRDKYGRLLAYVWFPVRYEGKTYYVLHNLTLILNGFGHAYTVFPFKDEYMRIFLEAQRFARENKIGLWSGADERKVLESLQKGQVPWAGQSGEVKRSSTGKPKVVIAYIHYRGKDEYVVIRNEGDAPVNLKGWKLWSKGDQWYTFPNITLEPGEEIKIHSGPGASGRYIWTRKYVWNNKGDEAVLYDSSGNVVDRYSY